MRKIIARERRQHYWFKVEQVKAFPQKKFVSVLGGKKVFIDLKTSNACK